MADFYPAAQQIQQPDILGNYLRGLSAPGQLQAQQLENTQHGLGIQQLQMALKNQQAYQDVAFQQLRQEGYGVGGAPAAGAQSSGGPTGGIQNGPQGSVTSQPSDGSISGFSPQTLGALAMLRGDDPLKTAEGVQNYKLQQTKLQLKGPMNLAESVISNPDAAKMAWNNPSMMQGWRQYAPRIGVDPNDPKAFTDKNVRRAATLWYNDMAGQAGEAPKSMPDELQNLPGPYGQLLQRSALTGKETEVTPQKLPTQALEKRYNPATGKNEGIMITTSPGGQPAPTAPGQNLATLRAGISVPRTAGAMGGAPGSQVGQTVDLGFPAPNAENLKAAALAGDMRAGLQGLDSLERKGIILTPSARAIIVHAATSDAAGLSSQLLSQEALSHSLSGPEQQYMAALMPVLQGAGHGMGGARLTTAQIRQLLESVVPVDTKNKAAMQQIRTNRQGYYSGMLGEAGSARETPLYKNTIGADYANFASGGHPANIQALLDKYK